MRKILIALVAAASIGAMSLATSSKAEAWWGWWGPGAVVGAFVGGAVVGSAIATTTSVASWPTAGSRGTRPAPQNRGIISRFSFTFSPPREGNIVVLSILVLTPATSSQNQYLSSLNTLAF